MRFQSDMEHPANKQTIDINGPKLQPCEGDQDTLFDLNNPFKIKWIAQKFISKVLLISGIRIASLFLTILLFILNGHTWDKYGDIIFFISVLMVIITFLCFALSKKARTSSPLNRYILLANQIGINLFIALLTWKKYKKYESNFHFYLLVTLALSAIDCIALMAVVKFTNFDVKSVGKLFWQTFLTTFVAHGIMYLTPLLFGHDWPLMITSLMIATLVLFVALLIMRSLMMLRWVSPSDYVAASIYVNDPLIYFISLCTEKRGTFGRQEQVCQMPANAQINDTSSNAPNFYPSKIGEYKLPI